MHCLFLYFVPSISNILLNNSLMSFGWLAYMCGCLHVVGFTQTYI